MSTIYTGAGVSELPSRKTWNPTTGWVTVREWKGTYQGILQLIPALQQDFTNLDMRQDGAYWLISASLPNAQDGTTEDEQVIDIWQLLGNDLEKTLWEHPKVVTELNALLAEEKLAAYKKAVSDDLEAWKEPEDFYNDHNITFGFDARPDLVSLYEEFVKGVEVFTVSQYVLRKTQVVGPNTNIKPSLANVNRVYSSAGLVSAEPVPATIKFSMPNGYWLKRTPTVEQINNGKFQFTTEWWHADAFSTFLYEPAI